MNNKKEIEELQSTEEIYEKGNKLSHLKIPSFGWLAFFWFALGQLLMILINATDGLIEYPTSLIVNISEIIPSVASVREADVFDNKIATLHYTIMWLLSVAFCTLSIFSPVGKTESIIFEKAKQPVLLAVIYVAIAVFNMLTNFYTGFYSFGLARHQFGFSVLSSFSTFIFPYAVRFVFLIVKIGANND